MKPCGHHAPSGEPCASFPRDYVPPPESEPYNSNVDPSLANRIGHVMRTIRKAHGKTSLQMAKDLGIERGNYSRSEAGRHLQRLDVIQRFCSTVGLSLAEFFKLVEK